MKCRNFFLGEYFIKFFSLVDRFWGEITSKHNDICWLVKGRRMRNSLVQKMSTIVKKKAMFRKTVTQSHMRE